MTRPTKDQLEQARTIAAAGIDFPFGWRAGIVAERAAYGRHVGEKSDAELRVTAVFEDHKVSPRVATWTLDVARLELARREALGA